MSQSSSNGGSRRSKSDPTPEERAAVPSVQAEAGIGRHGTSWLKRHRIKLVLSLLIAVGFGWLLHAGALPLIPPASAFAKMRWWTLPAYLAMYTTVHLVRASRWYWLLAPIDRVPLRRVVSVACIGFAAIVMLPFRTGEAVRPVMIRNRGKLNGWAATGTVGAERVIDGLVLSTVLFLALRLSQPLDPLPNSIGDLPIPVKLVPGAAYTALTLFAAAFSVMFVFYFARQWARRTTERVVGVASPRIAGWLATRIEDVADGLRFLPQLRYSAPFLAMTLVYWLLNAAGMWLLIWGSGFDEVTYAQACTTMGVLALGILLPNAPGFFGAFQFSIYAGLAMYFSTPMVTGPGAACVLLMYVSQLGITLLAALLAAAFERTKVSDALASDMVELETAPAADPRENLAAGDDDG